MPGLLVSIAGPSGAGKTTICRYLESTYPDKFIISISMTTRPPRPNERNGKQYFFVDRDAFDKAEKNGEILESNCYLNNKYGTPRNFVEKHYNNGKIILFDVDINGAAQIKNTNFPSLCIFLMPPSITELKKRIIARGDGLPKNEIEERLLLAREELAHAHEFDRIITNIDLDVTISQVQSFIEEHCK